MANIQWLFFDVGSTFVDEQESYEAFIAPCINHLKLGQILLSRHDSQANDQLI